MEEKKTPKKTTDILLYSGYNYNDDAEYFVITDAFKTTNL
jgi:hypothetical protein